MSQILPYETGSTVPFVLTTDNLPRARVAMTSAKSYMSLLSGLGA